ncbi:MAG: NOP58 family protein [Methanomicrobium sp.]|nr:NOP58 family protein [Methanomicrobium sp.]
MGENARCTFRLFQTGGKGIIAFFFFMSMETDMADFVPLRVADAIAEDIGFKDEAEYFETLRLTTIAMAESKIKLYYTKGDIELVQMVRMLDEMDNVINRLIERATEWYIVQNPKFSRKYKSVSAKKMVDIIRREKNSLGRLGYEIERLSNERTRLMREISDRADIIAPNCSALVGGLVAARLISRAGSLSRMAMMPASAVQVLGAESALFTHLRGNTPSPKHGIIFQHRRIHNAGIGVRGKVSRVLGGKLAIAARLDYYRGEIAPDFLEKAQERIDSVFASGEEGGKEEGKSGDKVNGKADVKVGGKDDGKKKNDKSDKRRSAE